MELFNLAGLNQHIAGLPPAQCASMPAPQQLELKVPTGGKPRDSRYMTASSVR